MCETCDCSFIESCKFYHNEYTTELLCIFKLPNELVHYITKYLYHYKGHILNYDNKSKRLCTACFQLGYYKIINSKKIITNYNIVQYFDSWIDDYYTKEVQTFCSKKNIPGVMDILQTKKLK